MADEQEKTEEATEYKLLKAREDGKVSKSADLVGFVVLVLGFGVLFLSVGFIEERFVYFYEHVYSFSHDINPKTLFILTVIATREFFIMTLAIALPVMIFGILGNILQFGFLFSVKPITPDLKKIDPVSGFKNLFSIKKIIEGLKIILKSSTVLLVACLFVFMFMKDLQTVQLFSLKFQMQWFYDRLLIACIWMLGVFFVFGVADFLIQRHNFAKEMKMSKQEVKDEMKSTDGDPQIKQRIRQMQIQISRNSMANAIKSADVLIVNPTHYAVALKFTAGQNSYPVVVAKGVDFLALYLREVAMENGVSIEENPPLARSLYTSVDLDQEISEDLAQAVLVIYQKLAQEGKISV